MKLSFGGIEVQSSVLKRLAARYSEGSEEESAIRLATSALHFVAVYHLDDFGQFLREQSEPLTEEQRAHLRGLGIKIEEE